jgi:signal transduction histidine kinase
MLSSFRGRLLAGFAIVITLSLFLLASGFVLLLRQQEADAAQQRIGVLVQPLTNHVVQLEERGFTRMLMRQLLVNEATNYDIRILLLDQDNVVVVDTHTEEGLLGEHIALHTAQPAAGDERIPTFYTQRISVPDEELYLFTAGDPGRGMMPGGPGTQLRLVVAVPSEDVTSAWARLLPRLAMAGGGAGVVAVIFASLFAARITNPIAQMTRASQAMAHGDLNQRIEVDGDDEVGRLAEAFNLMSSRVSRSDRAMRDLLANVSHELKTPLTSIQGFSQALVDGIADDPEEIGVLINEEANRIRVLVDDLLYLSEIESGTLRMELDDVDVDEVAAGTLRRFRFPAEEAGVELAFDLQGTLVRADGRRLEQVMANLLDNAIRFSPSGEAVTLRTRAQSDGVLIEVHNRGEPVPEEHLSRIFDRFYQADPSRAGARHRGLGLSIVQELVQAHGGHVTVDSGRERGTTFTIFLPAAGPPSTTRPVVPVRAAPAEERV